MARPYRFECEVYLPLPREQVFPFFADAANLQRITPRWLHFEVLTPTPIQMRAGAMIDYRLRVRGIRLHWQTRISVWEPPVRFVDVQLRGPYRLWRHEHTFIEHEGGTICHDRIDYDMTLGPLVNRLFVRRDVRHIFRYRSLKLRELFNVDTTGREGRFPAPSDPDRRSSTRRDG